MANGEVRGLSPAWCRLSSVSLGDLSHTRSPPVRTQGEGGGATRENSTDS